MITYKTDFIPNNREFQQWMDLSPKPDRIICTTPNYVHTVINMQMVRDYINAHLTEDPNGSSYWCALRITPAILTEPKRLFVRL